ncbi:MAG: M28 family peptidase [Bacteroidota bacterium]
MKTIYLLIALSNFILFANAQKMDDLITISEVERIERTLSADDMMGRKIFTPGIEKAAAFIRKEMRKVGLKKMDGARKYKQSFVMLVPTQVGASGTLDGKEIASENIIAFTSKKELPVNGQSGYRVIKIGAKDDFRTKVFPLTRAKENLLVIVDTAQARSFGGLKRFRSAKFPSEFSQVFVLSNADTSSYSFSIQHRFEEQKLTNVVGILPGKSRKDEYVIFSGHYDHLGFGKPDEKMDSLYNGANDDASGITAVLQLAKFYKAMKNNERTLVFVALTAEESGGFGANYFSRQLDPAKVVAMFNLEMIGTESKWGNNSAYITGYEKTDFGKILEQNLVGSSFKFYPDPYTSQNLFYRSDNATLARLGVPAHTISTSKMDVEPHYHKASDEIGTLDLKNMTEVIKSIAISAVSIVSGKDTPSRVKVEELR